MVLATLGLIHRQQVLGGRSTWWNKHFQLRSCSDTELNSRTRPCLQYQIKRCLAPCVFEIDSVQYQEMVNSVGLLLDNRHDELSQNFETKNEEGCRTMAYEQAAICRDQLRALGHIHGSQRIVSVSETNQDVLGIYRSGEQVELVVLEIRRGRLNDTSGFSFSHVYLPNAELISDFVRQYYGEYPDPRLIPDEILLPSRFDFSEATGQLLTELAGHRVLISEPKRGAKADLLAMAGTQAEHAYLEKKHVLKDRLGQLQAIQERLRLPTLPEHIECCDISHLAGSDAIGSVVHFHNGVPDKKRYRSFKIKQAKGGDDYGFIYEVLLRRFRRSRYMS